MKNIQTFSNFPNKENERKMKKSKRKTFNDLLQEDEKNVLNYRPTGNDGASKESWNII